MTATCPRSSGVVLIGVLIALALAALMAVQTGQRLADSRQRDNEAELLFVGEQYRQAIQSYWRESPGGARVWPQRLDDLAEDKRFAIPRRHLRKLYRDPLAPETSWGLVNQGAAVIGVYSQAQGMPFRQTGFSSTQQDFDGARRYADWRFVAALPATPGAAASGPGNGAGAGTGNSPAPGRGVPPKPAPPLSRGLR